MALYLGLDFGTSALRALVIDDRQEVVASSRVSLPNATTIREIPGSLEQDPDIWWKACQQALVELATQIELNHIVKICVDATSATTLLCNRQGQALTPALMYNDSRAREDAKQIAALAPNGHVCASANSSLAKAIWLFHSLPSHRQSHCLIQHQADWISAKFSGRFGYSDYHNCLKLGYDAAQAHWPDWLSQLPLSSRLFPQVVAPGSDLGPVDGELAASLGLSPQCHVVAGTTDSTAAILALGELNPGDAVTTLGSTLVVKVLTQQAINSVTHGVYSHYFFGQFLAGGASNTGGAVLRHFFTQAEIESLSARIDPQRDLDLDYYPLLRPGERFPIADPTLEPRMSPRPRQDSEFLHALMAGIAKIEKLGYDQLRILGAPYPKRVLTVGGGANSEVWRRIRERQLNIPVLNLANRESVLGTAMLAHSAPTTLNQASI